MKAEYWSVPVVEPHCPAEWRPSIGAFLWWNLTVRLNEGRVLERSEPHCPAEWYWSVPEPHCPAEWRPSIGAFLNLTVRLNGGRVLERSCGGTSLSG